MINKLLLVNINFVKADLLDKAGLVPSGNPIKILPLAWSEEDQPSHYGYEFTGLSLEGKDKLVKFDNDTDGTSLLDLGENDLNEVLKNHGLRVHPLS